MVVLQKSSSYPDFFLQSFSSELIVDLSALLQFLDYFRYNKSLVRIQIQIQDLFFLDFFFFFFSQLTTFAPLTIMFYFVCFKKLFLIPLLIFFKKTQICRFSRNIIFHIYNKPRKEIIQVEIFHAWYTERKSGGPGATHVWWVYPQTW